MREAAFLKQNTEKWKRYESEPTSNPDELAERFIEVTDDLAYARTFYKGTTTAQYINGLAQSFHQDIYKNKREHFKRFKDFWMYELPSTVKANHFKLLYAFIIFIVSVGIGVLSAKTDADFVRLILGDHYVNMTIENIKSGKPMAIYASENESIMFLSITANNIRVSFYAFIAGLFFSWGTMMLLFYNGVMLGAFQFFFYKYGYLLTSVLTIWIHGTLEISAIIVAGAAGFCLGNSILFPKTYSRIESFKRGASSGLKLVIGLVPLFITAGFLESFVTRHSDVSKLMSASVILISAAFIIWYFIIYPFQLEKKKTNDVTPEI